MENQNVHTSPSASPLTSCEILLSKNARLQRQEVNIDKKKKKKKEFELQMVITKHNIAI